jgi:DNA-binding protein YbaB
MASAKSCTACRIDPGLFARGDRELVEDLVTAATNQALAKAKQLQADAMKAVAGGAELPGLTDMLGRLAGLSKPGGDNPHGEDRR